MQTASLLTGLCVSRLSGWYSYGLVSPSGVEKSTFARELCLAVACIIRCAKCAIMLSINLAVIGEFCPACDESILTVEEKRTMNLMLEFNVQVNA